MGVVNMAKDIKKVHPEYVMMYKVGNFVQAFGKDAYVISYVFGYALRATKDNIQTCGFPKNAIPKVMSKLEQKKINLNDNKNLNTYSENFLKAQKYIKVEKRLEKIEEMLLKDVEKEGIMEKIRKIEEIVYENRKI